MVIAEGLFLLQHKGEHKTSRITQLAFDKFGLSPTNCAKVMNVWGSPLASEMPLSCCAI
ncbi:hypothetical protein GGQ85_003864 [Nitrobacter vulgaris]|nr:hypothetical protein [Nitrobacter vulgaris]